MLIKRLIDATIAHSDKLGHALFVVKFSALRTDLQRKLRLSWASRIAGEMSEPMVLVGEF